MASPGNQKSITLAAPPGGQKLRELGRYQLYLGGAGFNPLTPREFAPWTSDV